MERPRMVFADDEGKIYDHPDLEMCGMAGSMARPVMEEDLIPLPEGSDVFTLPGRSPLGMNPETGEILVVEELDGMSIHGVAAFMAPAYTQSQRAAFETREGAPTLPIYAYTAIGYRDGQFWVTGNRVDEDQRQDPYRFDLDVIEKNVGQTLKEYPDNRVISQLERCALEYGCRAAQNFFLSRWEAPLPVSIACNAQCVGCISLQPDGEFTASHDRLKTPPTAEEVFQVAMKHIQVVDQAVVSFGQGCEGEPLLMGDLLIESTRMIRQATPNGTINLNSNGSRPEIVKEMIGAGLDSIRVSMNSPREALYTPYYSPRGYGLKDCIESLRVVNRAGGFTSINLFVFPGVTDTEEELNALSELIEDVGLEMIQMRNLNVDPEVYERILPPGTFQEGMGTPRLMRKLNERFPRLRFGYYNPPKETYLSWRKER